MGVQKTKKIFLGLQFLKSIEINLSIAKLCACFRWSHPIDVDVSGNTRKYLGIPVKQNGKLEKENRLRKVTTLLKPGSQAWEIHGGQAAQTGAATSRSDLPPLARPLEAVQQSLSC